MKHHISVFILFMILFALVVMAVSPLTASAAGTTLSAGDIVFVGINSDGDDGFAFLLLRDIAAGTSVYITDKGWNGSGFAENEGDGIAKWTADSALTAGTVVYIRTSINGVVTDGEGNVYLSASVGTVIWIDVNDIALMYSTSTLGQYLTISYTGDQVFLYQGTHANPSFIAGIHYNVETGSTPGNWDGVADAATKSALPSQLTNGTSAIWVYTGTPPTEQDDFIYSGTITAGTPGELRAAIYNLNNWNADNTTAFTLLPYPYTFTVVGNEAPVIATNSGLTVSEGGSGSLQSRLTATDAESDPITYTVTTAPGHGSLSLSTFTQAQLNAGSVTYTHDGSNTTSDSFVFKISDGTNELTNQTFSITVTAVDDDAPTVAVNAGLTLNEGAAKDITTAELSATDADSADTGLVFTITTGPAHGQLENKDAPGVAISGFTQQNLSDGKIQYAHDDSNTTSDSFVFKVSDGTNELTSQTFSITVTAVDDDAPTVAVNDGLTLNEGAAKDITTAELSATDADSADAGLVFTITAAPAHGQLENIDAPGVAISGFTQQNLMDGKIQYVHDDSNTTSDSFVFKVSDGTNELTSQTFSNTVTLVDDDMPSITADPQDKTVAAGAAATFTVTADGGSAPTFQWQVCTDGATWDDVSAGTGGTTASYTTPAATAGMDGYQYRCTVTNAVGSDTSAAATLSVLYLTSTDADGIIPVGGELMLTPSKPGGTWNFDSALLSRSGGTFTALAAGTDAITYTVSAVSVEYDIELMTLALGSTDADGKIFVGGRVTLTPNVDGGTWEWDEEYLSATFNSPATFTALKTGTSTITYTVDGVSTTYDVTIEERSLPSTGQDYTWAWVLLGVALALAAAGVFVWRRRRARTSE